MTSLTWMVRNIPSRGFHRGDRWSKICQTVQLHSSADENALSVFELFAWCCVTFLELGDHDVLNTTRGREVGQLVTGRSQSPRRLLLWSLRILSTHKQPGVRWGDHEAREGHWGAEKRRDRSKNHENEAMVSGTRSRERSGGAHRNGQSTLSRTGTNCGRWWAACDETRCHASTSISKICQSEKTEQYRTSERTRKICTVPPPKTLTQKHGLTIVEVFLPQSVRKAGPDAVDYLPQHGFSQQKGWLSETWEYWEADFFKWIRTTSSILSSYFLHNFGETTTHMWSWLQRLTAYRQTQTSCPVTIA